MRPTRITVLASVTIALVACGIDAMGTALPPIDLPDGSTEPPATATDDAALPVDADAAAIDAAEDAPLDVIAETAPDAPLAALLELTHVAAPSTVNLTSEGPIDWAYWGAQGSETSLRKAGVNVISVLTTFTADRGATSSGFGTTFSWTNAPSGAGTSDGFYYVRGGAGVYESVKIPSGPATRTVVVWVGGNEMRGKLTATLMDGAKALTKMDESYESQAGAFAVQYTIEFRTALPSELEVKWELVQAYGVNSARFTAVALR